MRMQLVCCCACACHIILLQLLYKCLSHNIVIYVACAYHIILLRLIFDNQLLRGDDAAYVAGTLLFLFGRLDLVHD